MNKNIIEGTFIPKLLEFIILIFIIPSSTGNTIYSLVSIITLYVLCPIYLLIGFLGLSLVFSKDGSFFNEVATDIVNNYRRSGSIIYFRNRTQRYVVIVMSSIIAIILFKYGYLFFSFMFLFGSVMEDLSEQRMISFYKKSNYEIHYRTWI